MKSNMQTIIYNNEIYNKSINYSPIKFKKAYRYPTKVAILLPRTPELLFLISYLFRKNIAYILLDPNLPKEYIHKIIIESKVNICIDDYNNFEKNLSFSQENNNDLAYISYTSGSTGQPKGVEITRESTFNFIEGVSEIIDFSPGKRIACLTTVSFDIFFLESIMALYKGLIVVLANEDEQRNPKLMAKLIRDNAIEMIQLTPSRMQLLLNHDKNLTCLKDVKEIMVGGEPLQLSLLRILQEKTTAKIYNMYGPTETTIWSTVSDLTNKDRVDMGHAIKNTEIYIVDEGLRVLPEGQTGEICIGGKGLAKGYVGRDDLTAEKFIYLPQKPEIKVYRTGDLGCYLEDGTLEYLGRTDNQVKICGHRIELEEIESHLNEFEGINQSIVIALETSETDKRLEAFYTSENSIDTKNISDYLSSKLPSYMIPAIYRRVEEFIQTVNGKIDRKRVLECIEIKSDEVIFKSFASDKLTNIQKKALRVILSNLSREILDNISFDMNFASIGLNSITFIKIIVALEEEFNFEFDDEMLLITKFSTIKSMVEYVESKATTNCENS